MKRRSILVITGLLLLAFGLGVGLGSRFRRRPVVSPDEPLPEGAQEELPAPTVQTTDPPSGSPPPCVDIRNAGPLAGKSGCVAGLVLRVFSSNAGNTFLDFCQNYRTCPFTSVIFASDKTKFGDLESLQGKRVEIRGDVVTFQGRAEIIIHDPQQVRSAQ